MNWVHWALVHVLSASYVENPLETYVKQYGTHWSSVVRLCDSILLATSL